MTGTLAVQPRDLPEGTLTFLHADIGKIDEKSDPTEAGHETARAALRRLADAVVANTGGTLVQGSEGQVFAVFTNVVDGANAAIQLRDAVDGETWDGGEPFRARIGLHTGHANRASQGYVGVEVDRSLAVGMASNVDQILISDITRQLLENTDGDWPIIELGRFVLPGVSEAVSLSELAAGSSPRTPLARRWSQSNLPETRSGLIGRTTDLEAAAELLRRDQVRMVTVTGPGGIGKTRAAIELANQMIPDFPGGVHFVDLSALRDPDLVLPAIGRALGILESDSRTIPQAVGTVVGDSHLLFVVDNMEHLVEAGVGLGELFQEAPNLKLLVTSRVPLRVRWEYEYPLGPLQVPEPGITDEVSARSESVALFVERASEASQGFTLDETNSSTIAEICRRLDGLPLAIELAAARLATMSPDELLEALGHRLDLLARDDDVPERHRTLRAAIEWSHDLLDSGEKILFRRLAVFAGGWSLEAAEMVCGDPDGGVDVLAELGDLVAQSLAVFYIDDLGEPRYRMLETLREFALERLRQSGEEEGRRTRHRAWCLDLAQRLEAGSPTPRFPELLDEMEREIHNVREALSWALAGDDPTAIEDALSIAGLAWLFWDIRGLVNEALEWSARLLERSHEATSGRAGTLMAVAWLSALHSEHERAAAAIAESISIRRALGDPYWLAWALSVDGMLTYNQYRPEEAKGYFEESIEVADGIGFMWISQGWSPYGLGHIAWMEGDLATARKFIERTLDISTEHGLLWGIGHAQLSLSLLDFFGGDITGAGGRIAESVRIRQRIRDARGIGDCLSIMAVYAAHAQDHNLAARLLGASDRQQRATGHTLVPWLAPFYEEAAIAAGAGLGEESFQLAFDEGSALTTDAAIDLALDGRSGLPVLAGVDEA